MLKLTPMFKLKPLVIATSLATPFLLAGCNSSDGSSDSGSSISGQVIDGYWVGAKVCVDRNDNQKCDPDEPTSLSGEQGRYNIPASRSDLGNYPMLAVVTEDTYDSEGKALSAGQYLVAPKEMQEMITPLTTAVYATMKTNDKSFQDALNDIHLTRDELNIDYIAYNDIGLKNTSTARWEQWIRRANAGKYGGLAELGEAIALTKDYPVMISALGLEAVEDLLYHLDDGTKVTDTENDPARYADPNTRVSQSSGNILDINKENIETMVLGAQVNMPDSTFQNKPIFDVSLLKQYGFADINDVSAATGESSIVFSSSTSAENASSNIREKSGFSLKFGGFGFGATQTHEEQTSQFSSNGESYLTMMYSNTGGYAVINTENFAGGNSLESYLAGTKISNEALAQYVHLTEDENGRYTALEIDKRLALRNYDYNSNPYGVIQQLTELEYTFDKLRSQYHDLETITAKSASEETLFANTKSMLMPLRSEINDSIDKFYATFGTHFVSKIDLAAYGKGSGVLKASQSAANKEVINGGGLSMGYKGVSKGGNGEASVSNAYQNGWSQAFKDINVTAVSKPEGTIDVTEWASDIMTNLQKATDAPPAIPALSSVNDKVDYTWAPAGELKEKDKDKSIPPDSVFSSYADWKQYQEDIKAKDDIKPPNETLEKIKEKYEDSENIIKEVDEDQESDPKSLAIRMSATSSDSLYEQYFEERAKIMAARQELTKARAAGKDSPDASGGSVRIDNKIVIGFESARYDTVLPALTPDLDFDNSIKAADYDVTSELLVLQNEMNQLGEYIQFASNYKVTNTQALSDQFHPLIKDFNKDVNDLIKDASSAGVDVDIALVNALKARYFGRCDIDADSKMMDKFDGDLAKYNYVCYMMNKAPKKVWMEGSNGYLVVVPQQKLDTRLSQGNYTYSTMENGIPKIVAWRYFDYKTGSYTVATTTSTEFAYGVSQSGDLMGDYAQSFEQTPLFPLFILKNSTTNPRLFFVQHAKQLTLLYSDKYLFAPQKIEKDGINSFKVLPDYNWDNTYNITKYTPKAPSMVNQNGAFVYKDDPQYTNAKGFNINTTASWDYSLKFKDELSNKQTREKFNVLLLNIAYDYKDGYNGNPTPDGYLNNGTDQIQALVQDQNKPTGYAGNSIPIPITLLNTETGDEKTFDASNSDKAKVVLLPLRENFYLDYANKPFSITSRYGVDDMAESEGFYAIDVNAIFK